MLVRVVVLVASVALLVGVWLWCATREKAERARARVQAVRSSSSAGRHRLSDADVQWRGVVPAWPSRDPDAKDPGRWTRPGASAEPTGRHALAT